MLSVRRRGEAAPAYAQKLGRAFAAGASRERAERDRLACLSCLAELAPLCRDIQGWGLDALDLAMAGLDGRDDVTRRGAAFLGAALVSGAFLDAYPKVWPSSASGSRPALGDGRGLPGTACGPWNHWTCC